MCLEYKSLPLCVCVRPSHTSFQTVSRQASFAFSPFALALRWLDKHQPSRAWYTSRIYLLTWAGSIRQSLVHSPAGSSRLSQSQLPTVPNWLYTTSSVIGYQLGMIGISTTVGSLGPCACVELQWDCPLNVLHVDKTSVQRWQQAKIVMRTCTSTRTEVAVHVSVVVERVSFIWIRRFYGFPYQVEAWLAAD